MMYRCPDSHTCFFFFLDVAFSEYLCVPFLLSLCMEITSYVLSFRMVCLYLIVVV